MSDLLQRYQALLAEADAWFARSRERYPQQVQCALGCSGCCRGLFDISLLDAALLRTGFARLPESTRRAVRRKARRQLDTLLQRWPDFAPPYILNRMPDAEWTAMPEDDPTPCALLDADGRCLVYPFRPLTCRTHGLPQVDCSGEVFDDACCTLNFPAADPLAATRLRWEFRRYFEREFALLGEYAATLLGRPHLELDTFIPCALLFPLERFDWRGWEERHLFG